MKSTPGLGLLVVETNLRSRPTQKRNRSGNLAFVESKYWITQDPVYVFIKGNLVFLCAVNILKNKLPTKLYEGLEKQAVILSNAENQQHQHPNDKDRDFFNELAYQKLKDDIDEAGYRYQDDEKFDILNNKIPDNILKELKTASINFDKLAISVIDASLLSSRAR